MTCQSSMSQKVTKSMNFLVIRLLNLHVKSPKLCEMGTSTQFSYEIILGTKPWQ